MELFLVIIGVILIGFLLRYLIPLIYLSYIISKYGNEFSSKELNNLPENTTRVYTIEYLLIPLFMSNAFTSGDVIALIITILIISIILTKKQLRKDTNQIIEEKSNT